MIRRRRSKIDGVYDVSTRDGATLRVKPFATTDKRIQNSQRKIVRDVMKKTFTTQGKSNTLSELVKNIIDGKVGRDIYKNCKQLYPVKRVEIYRTEVIQQPTIMIEEKKTEPKKEEKPEVTEKKEKKTKKKKVAEEVKEPETKEEIKETEVQEEKPVIPEEKPTEETKEEPKEEKPKKEEKKVKKEIKKTEKKPKKPVMKKTSAKKTTRAKTTAKKKTTVKKKSTKKTKK